MFRIGSRVRCQPSRTRLVQEGERHYKKAGGRRGFRTYWKINIPARGRFTEDGWNTGSTTGATTGYDSSIDLRYLFFKGTNLLGSTQGTKADLEQVIHWTSKGRIKPLISTVLPFSDMVKGHTMMANADQIGKILTTPQKL